MHVTVAICTWNRAKLLDSTLVSFRTLQVPAGLTWELIVVDNNSTDGTPDVVRRHAEHLPIVALFEPRAGKSHAANLAVSMAKGDLIIWTDDDVKLSPDWLKAYVDAASEWPDAAYFAGPIDPWFESTPPPWILRHLDDLKGVFVIVDHGPTQRKLLSSDAVFGANMAFRASAARRFPLNAELGRIKGSLLGADDTELIRRAVNAGMYGVWVPSARLEHYNPTTRLTLEYVKRWYSDAGRSLVRQGGIHVEPNSTTIPHWILRQYVQHQARRAAFAAFGGKAWFESFIQAMRLEGVMKELHAKAGSLEGTSR